MTTYEAIVKVPIGAPRGERLALLVEGLYMCAYELCCLGLSADTVRDTAAQQVDDAVEPFETEEEDGDGDH